MTAAAMTDRPGVYTPPANYKLSAVGLLHSEWTKLWSLRSTWIVLLCAALFGAGIGVATAATYAEGLGGIMNALDYTLFGVSLSSVFIAVLGVLTITGEYSTGSIRSTMSAAPKRLGVLWAKAFVFAAVVAALYAVVVFGTFFVSQALLSGTDLGGMSLSDDGVLRVLFGHVASTVYLGLLGVGIGAVLRNSAGGIGFYVAAILVLPNLATLLPWSWVADVVPYAPGNVAGTLTMLDTTGASLSLGASWLWMGVWLAVTFGLAGVLLKRRDV
jgi:ABC-2 type transport system permease protein